LPVDFNFCVVDVVCEIDDVLLWFCFRNDAELSAINEFNHVGAVHKSVCIW
jgi:hypothetical protein